MEAVRANQSLPEVEYWDMVETQLLALSGHSSGRTVRRTEQLVEPAVDPVLLEKILRSRLHPAFAGYSGTEIDESDLAISEQELENLRLNGGKKQEEEAVVDESGFIEDKLDDEERQENEEESSSD